jgi:hypothetical protein
MTVSMLMLPGNGEGHRARCGWRIYSSVGSLFVVVGQGPAWMITPEKLHAEKYIGKTNILIIELDRPIYVFRFNLSVAHERLPECLLVKTLM